ncbi:hypothetical protein CORC01_06251, partial [Colletotrichum orchidophilum]
FDNPDFSKLQQTSERERSDGHCLCYRRAWIGSPGVSLAHVKVSVSRFPVFGTWVCLYLALRLR